MSKHPKIQLSKLREIAWSLWDPIGLLTHDSDWASTGFADEYDTYLIKVAGMLRNGEPLDDAVEYLIRIETEHMGLTEVSGIRERAERVVEALISDHSIWRDPKS
jgi:hypothetical protein